MCCLGNELHTRVVLKINQASASYIVLIFWDAEWHMKYFSIDVKAQIATSLGSTDNRMGIVYVEGKHDFMAMYEIGPCSACAQ